MPKLTLHELIKQLATDYFSITSSDDIVSEKQFYDHLVEWKNTTWTDDIKKLDLDELQVEFAEKYVDMCYLTIRCNLINKRVDDLKQEIQNAKNRESESSGKFH